MPILCGITFQKLGKLHYYPSDGFLLEPGMFVIAETEQGVEFGEVKILRTVEGRLSDMPHPFRIVRVATESDRRTMEGYFRQAQEALEYCQKRATELQLPMKLVEAEPTWDGHQITLYFVADARVDFRQLVKDAAAQLKTRVHLHQVGARDHAKALGGYGPCGRPLCCTTFLQDFAPVSMKMAKDQSLYLNPSKFSGVCGKLMCCLRYEHDTYLEAKDSLPSVGMTVTLPSGERGTITEMNIFKRTLTVLVRGEEFTRSVTVRAEEATVARACGDCGSVGGGCGSDGCASSGSCGSSLPPQKFIQLETRTKPSPSGSHS
jgi:cell fate regulator YaaT (PSP1 superfamily)